MVVVHVEVQASEKGWDSRGLYGQCRDVRHVWPWLSREGVLDKGGEPGTPRGVYDEEDGISRRPDNTSERFVTIRVSGAFQVIDALGVIRPDGKFSKVDCSGTMRPVAGAWPVDGSGMRGMASEREACNEE